MPLRPSLSIRSGASRTGASTVLSGWRAFLALMLAVAVLPVPASAQEGTRISRQPAQQATASIVEVVEVLPVIRPEFPVPQEPGQLFYLQRSTNSNTIVYAAQFLADGRLDPAQPVIAFWRRFNTTGERLPLKMVEDSFAFGVRAQPTQDPDVYRVYVVSYPERMATLRRTAPGQAELTIEADGRTMRPVYAYVDVDEDGLVPSVRSVTLAGHDLASGKPLVERILIE